MTQKQTIRIALISFLIVSGVAWGQTSMLGGKGLYRTLSAEVVGSKNLYVNSYFSSYFIKESESLMAKDHTLNVSATFGFAKHLEASLRIIPYQDDQKSIWGPPGDTQLGLKYHLPFLNSSFHLGLNTFFIFPTARHANVGYEPFSTDKTAWGAHLLMTLSLEKILPTLPIKIHGNFGYIDHSMDDQFFTSEIDQMLLGFGIVFPVRSFQLFTEYTSEVFMNTAEIDYMENSMRATQGLKFLGPKNIIFDLVFDFGLTNKDSISVFKKEHRLTQFMKDYADWKVTVGVTYRFSLNRFFDRGEAEERKQEAEEKKKLDKIKSKREKANDDLDSMKRILDRNIKEKKKK